MNKIIVLLLVGLLTACGFQPLYAKKQSTNNNVIQQVQIYPIGERTGQILYNRLNDIMNPYGNPSKAPYQLRSDISISSSSLGVECVAGTGDSEEKTLPMFRREVREIKSFFSMGSSDCWQKDKILK